MFKPRPYDPDREDKQTDAQRAATYRNFGIFKLRGLWANAALLQEPYRTAARVAIDADLVKRGALDQLQHERAVREKRYAEYEKQVCPECNRSRRECECVPF